MNEHKPDPRWKDLYRVGGISCVLVALLILFAVIIFFIWPFKPGFTSTVNIFRTLWMIYTILISVSAFIFSWLMLASSEFSKWIAYIRIACGIKGPCIFIPVIGIPISLLATIAGIIWYLLIARTLIKIGWQ